MSNLPALPSQVTLYGLPYTITLSTNLMMAENRYGETNLYTYSITIDAGLPLAAQWATLCHEVIHIIDFAQKLAFTEETVHRLDTGVGEFVLQLLGGAGT